MTKEEIFKSLQNGADPQKLAEDFANMLNDAIAMKKKEDEALQEKQKLAAELNKDVSAWLDHTKNLCKLHYPKFYDGIKDATIEDAKDYLSNGTFIISHYDENDFLKDLLNDKSLKNLFKNF